MAARSALLAAAGMFCATCTVPESPLTSTRLAITQAGWPSRSNWYQSPRGFLPVTGKACPTLRAPHHGVVRARAAPDVDRLRRSQTRNGVGRCGGLLGSRRLDGGRLGRSRFSGRAGLGRCRGLGGRCGCYRCNGSEHHRRRRPIRCRGECWLRRFCRRHGCGLRADRRAAGHYGRQEDKHGQQKALGSHSVNTSLWAVASPKSCIRRHASESSGTIIAQGKSFPKSGRRRWTLLARDWFPFGRSDGRVGAGFSCFAQIFLR